MTRQHGIAVWGFATFHASVFVLVALLVVCSRGGLGIALQGLNTIVGLALFVALWTTTYIATRNALRGLDISAGPIDANRFTGRAIRWGALNGVMFLGILAIGLVANFSLTVASSQVPLPQLLASAGFAAGGLVVASAFALAIGGVIGLVFSGIDLILLGIAARLVKRASWEPEPGSLSGDVEHVL